MKMRSVAALGAVLMLGGCGNYQNLPPPAVATLTDFPTDYRQQIVKQVRTTFFDPYSIRDAEISEPFLNKSVIAVCIKANAKNRMGGYIGIRPTAYYFKNGGFAFSESDFAPVVCDKAKYGPFPEIDAAAIRRR